MSQPGVFAALKKAKRGRFEIGFIHDITKELNNSSDRVNVIVWCSLVDDALRTAISRRFVKLSGDDDEKIFEGQGPLASFSNRIRVAYALGVIDREQRNDLDRIRELRNAFAHGLAGLTFTDKVIVDICLLFTVVQRSKGKIKNFPNISAKMAFSLACTDLWVVLGKRVKSIEIGGIKVETLVPKNADEPT